MADSGAAQAVPGTAHRLERAVSIAVLMAMTALPLVEIAGRLAVGRGVSGSIVLVQHLTLWVTLLGAALAARSDRLLALSTQHFLSPTARRPVRMLTSALAVGISASLCLASFDVVCIERETGDVIAWGVPVWVGLTVLPAGFALVTGRLVRSGAETLGGRLVVALGLAVPIVFGLLSSPLEAGPFYALAIIVAAVALGMPIFAGIGGAAMLMFWNDGTPINAVAGETYRLTTSPMLPAIPLFALGGYILAEGGAGHRLTRMFEALVGWMPGGLAVVTTLVLAFFTPLTGASGVTILSMGGLLLPMMLKAGYGERTSTGLVTVSGSIGLLFFPSLPVFLYAFYAGQSVERIFVGGLIPGILLVGVVALWAGSQGWLGCARKTPFSHREALSATWAGRWEIGLPIVVLGAMVTGVATLVEAAAVSVAYALLSECLVHRDLSVSRDLPRIVTECTTLVGGFMIILCVALGLTNFFVLAEIPLQALEWAEAHITSPLVFLLALNVFLILVGAVMDIYSAIVVVVPLVVPMAESYGIDSVHLAVLFLANMELGYLMPPMGENLFLSSYRFDQPLTRIYRSTLPYTAILLATVLLITYVPQLTLSLVDACEAAGLIAPR